MSHGHIAAGVDYRRAMASAPDWRCPINLDLHIADAEVGTRRV